MSRTYTLRLFIPLLLICATLVLSSTKGLAAVFDTGDDSVGATLGQSPPQLRIAYVASSKGELYPCPTCGDNSLGGLARRATVTNQLKSFGAPLITLAGSEEFLSDLDLMRLKNPSWNKNDPKNKHNETEKAKRLLAGYTLLKIDAGLLLSEEATWLKEYAGGIPAGFTEVGTQPASKTITTPAGKVGLVFFPKGTEKNGFPSQQQVEAVLAAGKALYGKVSLVVGISPWGNVAEHRFLPKAEGTFSVLFGGGPGLSYAYSAEFSTKSLLWVRSESHGRAVNSLDILEMPAPGHPAQWQEGISFTADQTFLFLRLPPDPTLERIIGKDASGWYRQ